MHIAAYMAALDIDDLDHMAKVAVQKVAGRANQRTGTAWVSIARIADDLGVAYNTARLALDRAVDAGYLAVDKPVGRRPKWQLTPRVARGVTPSADDTSTRGDPVRSARGPRQQRATKDDIGVLGEEASAATASGSARFSRRKTGPRSVYDGPKFGNWSAAE